MSSQFLIGIDAGGTKSQLAVWRLGELTEEKKSFESAIFECKNTGINLDLISEEQASDRLLHMLHLAAEALGLDDQELADQSSLVVGMAGLDTDLDWRSGERWFTNTVQPFGWQVGENANLLSDVELGLWSASPNGEGIVLIAGTGSNCFGRLKSGETAKAGGMSHFFSDEGSGFALGWEALHLLGKMYDGRLPWSDWARNILEAYEVEDIASVKKMIVRAEDYKYLVARAAPAVQAAAAARDPLALPIVEKNINDLAALVQRVTQKLQTQSVPLFLVGGLFQDEFYRESLLQKLQQLGYQPPHFVALTHPVVGAIHWHYATMSS